jgi:hypothetical protein
MSCDKEEKAEEGVREAPLLSETERLSHAQEGGSDGRAC